MPLFTRRHSEKLTDSPTASGRQRPGRAHFSFMAWIRLHALDLITMACMGAIGLGVYRARKCQPLI